jgi:hypothetical protein
MTDTGEDVEQSILSIDDVRQVTEWAGGHPVLGPVARSAVFWHDEAERAKAAARDWRQVAVDLGWVPHSGRTATPNA